MKLTSAFLLVILTIAYACKQADSVAPLPAGFVALQPGRQVMTPAGPTVIADTVYISICPKDAACFVADNVMASVRVIQNQESKSVWLFAGFGAWSGRTGNRSDSTSVRLGDQLYKVILRGQYTGETDKGVTGRAILQVAPL
ncbi:hypothetical protein [Fibrivirga algicola]|uniref:Gliding motility-associated lipoprotein GldH n=1 Tax=Fibrivirga algicola TaxID=2950420 RepID=A0ABX0QAQ0_9BACT|nr:hypothetical protein [Fibrivirga algicola]NID09061.1 hypothetical protein [Fibrivirga algicola]